MYLLLGFPGPHIINHFVMICYIVADFGSVTFSCILYRIRVQLTYDQLLSDVTVLRVTVGITNVSVVTDMPLWRKT